MAFRHQLLARATKKAARYGFKGTRAVTHAAIIAGFWATMGPIILYAMYQYDPNKEVVF